MAGKAKRPGQGPAGGETEQARERRKRRSGVIRRRWLINTLAAAFFILAGTVAVFTVSMFSYYTSTVMASLESRTQTVADMFQSYTESSYRYAARQYINQFQEKNIIEVQFLTSGGRILMSSLMDISGGADYDAVNVTINQFRTLVAQGALQPLDELLDVYGQDILNSGHSAEVWDALRGEDGHIYAVPYMYPCDHEIANFMVARMDLCKAAGITEMPTTLDGFYDMLVKLKEYYGDEYIILSGPFYQASEANEAWAIPKTITSAFGIYSDWMVNSEGKVIYMTEHENFPALVEFMSKLYSEGLIDPDWAVNTESTLKEKFSSGKTIICCGNRGLGDYAMPALMENLQLTWDDIDYISALSGSDGTCKYMETTAFNFVTCVPKSSDNAADVVNWWNLRLKNDLHITIGDVGVHFNYDAEGKIDPINPIFAEERGNSYWYMDVTSATWGSQMWPARVRKSASQWHAFSAVTMNADTNRIEFTTNEFKFKPATEAYSKYNTTLFNSLKDYLLQVMAGIRTIDDLEVFMKDWSNAGGEEVRTELQNFYDSKH